MKRSAIVLAGMLTAGAGLAQTNVAPAGVATQTSNFPGGEAWRAIDGNTDGDWADRSVTSTGLELQPWWQLALGAEHAVQQVVVWNRTDCCASRLSDYTVSLWRGGAAVDSRFFAGTSPVSQVFAFDARAADTVRVQLSGTNYLSLAEVQVFASPVPEPQGWALMLGGLVAVGSLARRRQRGRSAAAARAASGTSPGPR